MKHRFIARFLFAACGAVVMLTACHKPSEPRVTRGTLTMHEIASQWVSSRMIRVWTPEGYPKDAPYEVLYMHDGQMLYDAAFAWNHQEWGVDEVAQQLMDSNRVRPFIVVGVDNSDDRIEEYTCDAAVQYREDGEPLYNIGTPMGNRYLAFLTQEVKPFIDSTYRVFTDFGHTFVMGSSCGGLISSYALCRYPDVFGGAACMSTHCTFAHIRDFEARPQSTEAYLHYLSEHLPPANTRKVYFDSGDKTLDKAYLPIVPRIDSVVRAVGYDSAHYQYHLFTNAAHTEDDWRARLDIPLIFLLGK